MGSLITFSGHYADYWHLQGKWRSCVTVGIHYKPHLMISAPLARCDGYIYLFAVIRFAFNLSITLNDNWMDQSVHRTLNPLQHCLASIFALFFLFYELSEALRDSRGWLTADSSNYLLLISAKTEERRKFIINNPSREWHWTQITASTSF